MSNLTADERLSNLELILRAAFLTADAKTRHEILAYLRTQYPKGSWGNGNFDRQIMKAQELVVDRAINFVKVGEYLV